MQVNVVLSFNVLFPGSNNSIEELDLSWNQLRRNGAVAVCNGLKVSDGGGEACRESE